MEQGAAMGGLEYDPSAHRHAFDVADMECHFGSKRAKRANDLESLGMFRRSITSFHAAVYAST